MGLATEWGVHSMTPVMPEWWLNEEDEDDDKISNNNNNNKDKDKAVATMICNRQFAAASVLEKLAALNLKSS